MHNSIRLGFGIAALFAAGVIGVRLFGGNTESYFVRAAQESAVRCLTGAAACQRIDGAAVRDERAGLAKGSVCAAVKGWKEDRTLSNGQSFIVVRCTDGAKTYLYHMGRLANADAGNEQWMVCTGSDCMAAAKALR